MSNAADAADAIDPVTPGAAVAHFEVRRLDGRHFRYLDVWQRRNLVVASLPAHPAGDAYAAELRAHEAAFAEQESVCVATRDRIPGLPVPGLLVADRWGEVVHVVTAGSVYGLPPAAEVLQWLEAIEYRCPECEGEAR